MYVTDLGSAFTEQVTSLVSKCIENYPEPYRRDNCIEQQKRRFSEQCATIADPTRRAECEAALAQFQVAAQTQPSTAAIKALPTAQVRAASTTSLLEKLGLKPSSTDETVPWYQTGTGIAGLSLGGAALLVGAILLLKR